MKISKLKILLFIIQTVVIGFLLVLFACGIDILIALASWSVTSLAIFCAVYYFEEYDKRNNIDFIDDEVNSSGLGALEFGDVGFLIYDNNFKIKWMSGLFKKKNIDQVNETLTVWIPELMNLINGDVDEINIILNEDTFAVKRQQNQPVLLFKDISREALLKRELENTALVIGQIHFDNYQETILYLDESQITQLYVHVRQPVIDYFDEKGIVIKQLRTNNKFMVITNEDGLRVLSEDKFSIMETVKENAKKLGLDITLSMAFTNGSNDIGVLDGLASELLSLLQSRGGAQTAIKNYQGEIKFIGGTSEANYSVSNVRARVMAQTSRRMIQESDNVIIVGHKEMDADCISSTLIASNIAQALDKPAAIIGKNVGIEPVILSIMEEYKDDIYNKHDFISEEEAHERMNENTLVIMVDHHNLDISSAPNIISKAKKLAIFDHHRRIVDLKYNPTLIYIEPGSSSATELMTEFFPYIDEEINLNEGEVNIMYIGMLIDTNNFVNRTTSKTFEIVGYLRSKGADPIKCDQLLQEPYENLLQTNEIFSYSKKYDDNIMIAAVDNNKEYSRTVLSKVANSMLRIKGIEATFVIAKISPEVTSVTARSSGKLNVQVLMEQMNGGGHLTQAATQIEGKKIKEVNKELLSLLMKISKENETNESNTTK